MDLFDYQSYPERAGHKRTATSREAARAIMPKRQTLKDRAYLIIKSHPEGLTADEIANEMGRSILSVRPRISELKNDGLIEATGDTRKNESGINADIMKAMK